MRANQQDNHQQNQSPDCLPRRSYIDIARETPSIREIWREADLRGAGRTPVKDQQQPAGARIERAPD